MTQTTNGGQELSKVESPEFEVQVIDSSFLELQQRAEIDVQIATAKAYPRSIKIFMDRALSIATINEDVAASCNYALPRDGRTIEGPSVRLAEIVCSTYCNIRSGARVISNDGKKITAQGFCHDLETNNAVTVEVSRRITNKKGQTFSEDMQIVTGNAAAAIAYRNAVFKIVPTALVSNINEQIKEVAKGTAETLVRRRDKIVNWLHEKGIKDEQICAVLGVKRVEDIDIEKLFILQGIGTAIRNGDTTLEQAFSIPEKGDSSAMSAKVKEAAAKQTAKAKEAGTDGKEQ